MKRYAWIAVTLILGAVAAGIAAPPAMAQKMKPVAVAVIDSQRIGREALAFKDAREQLQKIRAGYQSEVAKEEEKFRAEEQELARQRTVLTGEAFDARRRDFERRVTEVQRHVQERSRQLEQSFNDVRGEVGKVMLVLITDLAKERDFALVIDKAQTAYRADGLDITDEVLKRLDKKLPTIKVTLPPG
jgi:Skp family chaperone for outer membrane proteins